MTNTFKATVKATCYKRKVKYTLSVDGAVFDTRITGKNGGYRSVALGQRSRAADIDYIKRQIVYEEGMAKKYAGSEWEKNYERRLVTLRECLARYEAPGADSLPEFTRWFALGYTNIGTIPSHMTMYHNIFLMTLPTMEQGETTSLRVY